MTYVTYRVISAVYARDVTRSFELAPAESFCGFVVIGHINATQNATATAATVSAPQTEAPGTAATTATASMPEVWTYHATELPDGSVGVVYGEMQFKPDGALLMLDRGKDKKPRTGHWKADKKGDKVTIKMDDLEGDAAVWLMTITATTATLDRDVGRRFMRMKAP